MTKEKLVAWVVTNSKEEALEALNFLIKTIEEEIKDGEPVNIWYTENINEKSIGERPL